MADAPLTEGISGIFGGVFFGSGSDTGLGAGAGLGAGGEVGLGGGGEVGVGEAPFGRRYIHTAYAQTKMNTSCYQMQAHF